MKYIINKDRELTLQGVHLYRVVRCSDGLVGGYVEKASNLSTEGDCFIYDDAMVFGNARVEGNAEVAHNSIVCGSAIIKDEAMVMHKSVINGFAKVRNNAVVNDVRVGKNADIHGYMVITGSNCFETPSIITDLYEDDILIYNNVFQIGACSFNLKRLMNELDYFLTIEIKLPKYANYREAFINFIKQHRQRMALHGKSNF